MHVRPVEQILELNPKDVQRLGLLQPRPCCGDPPPPAPPGAYPKTPNCMFLPTENPPLRRRPLPFKETWVSVRGFSCPSSGVLHLHVVQRLLLSVLRAACAPLLRGSSPRACGDT